jgi:hypothetical protein
VLASTARGVCSLPESKWSDAHEQQHVVVTRLVETLLEMKRPERIATNQTPNY